MGLYIMERTKTKPTEDSETFYEVKLHPKSPVRADQVTVYETLGPFLRQARLRREVSLREAALEAGLSPMYLSLLERDACGSPSNDKLQALAQVLGTHEASLFARAGRVHPSIAQIILRHPSEWSALIDAGKDLNSAQLRKLKDVILAGFDERGSEAYTHKTQMPHLREQGEEHRGHDGIRADVEEGSSSVGLARDKKIRPQQLGEMPHLREQGKERSGQGRRSVEVRGWSSLVGPAREGKIGPEQLRAIIEAAENEELRQSQFGLDGRSAKDLKDGTLK